MPFKRPGEGSNSPAVKNLNSAKSRSRQKEKVAKRKYLKKKKWTQFAGVPSESTKSGHKKKKSNQSWKSTSQQGGEELPTRVHKRSLARRPVASQYSNRKEKSRREPKPESVQEVAAVLGDRL